MGNVTSLSEQENFEGVEWLEDMKESQVLDFSRKVNHAQFLKVISLFLCFLCMW